MTESNEDYVEGSSLTPDEISSRFDIPVEEAAFYQDSIRIYPSGAAIISEGDEEEALYLLRCGTVDVVKGGGDSPTIMGSIDAVNVFGEMSMINDEPRSASVRATTNEVVVYRIATPNIHTILTNPAWAELLISRLCKNLADSVELVAQLQAKLKELNASD